MNNIGYCICEIINKLSVNAKGDNYIPELVESILSPEIIKMIMNNIMGNDKIVSICNAPVLYHYFI